MSGSGERRGSSGSRGSAGGGKRGTDRATGRSSAGRPPADRSKGAPGRGTRRPPERSSNSQKNASRTDSRGSWDQELLAASLAESPLSKDVIAELDTFPEKVSALLGAAYLLLDEDPLEALRYAQGAKQMASRSAAVREAVGVAAYHTGDYSLAIKELRSAARISGDDELMPLIADCERGLGRPEKALEIAGKDLKLNRNDRVEMRLIAAGARMDLGQPEEAMMILRGPALESDAADESSARLKYVYAEALLAAGQPETAREWFLRAAAADPEALTDAWERVESLNPGSSSDRDGSGTDSGESGGGDTE